MPYHLMSGHVPCKSQKQPPKVRKLKLTFQILLNFLKARLSMGRSGLALVNFAGPGPHLKKRQPFRTMQRSVTACHI